MDGDQTAAFGKLMGKGSRGDLRSEIVGWLAYLFEGHK